MKKLQIKFCSQFLAISLLLTRVKSKKICKPGQEDVTSQPFHLTARDISRLKKDIISESNVLRWLDCGTSCLGKRVCVAFNFKEKSKENEINCQLTHTADNKFERASAEDNGWTFYKTAGERMFGCREEYECLNGEAMIWDPVKPFECECPKRYKGQLCEKCPLALNLHGHDTTQYGISKGSPQALVSITACFLISAPEVYVNNYGGTVLSYATLNGATKGNDFLLVLGRHLKFRMRNQLYSFQDLFLADGQLHHVCVTWESSSGNFTVYKDGVFVKTKSSIKTGEKIKGGGIWVIGQDQDSMGGGFQAKDSFKGILTEVNIWNKALDSDEINRNAKDCGSLVQGNYKAYSDFNISSATELIKPSCCPLAPLSEP